MTDWKEKRLFRKDKLIANSMFNAILYIENIYPNIYGYDYDNDRTYVIACPPWEIKLFTPHVCESLDIIALMVQLEKYGIRVSYESMANAVKHVASATPYKPTISRAKSTYELTYACPDSWFEKIKADTLGNLYAFPNDLLNKLLPAHMQDMTARRKITRALSKLGFKPTSERYKGNKTSLVRQRWKRVFTPIIE